MKFFNSLEELANDIEDLINTYEVVDRAYEEVKHHKDLEKIYRRAKKRIDSDMMKTAILYHQLERQQRGMSITA